MLPRAISVTILLAYLISVSGVSVLKHYCGNELASSSLFIKGEGCGCNELEENKECCKDETQFLKNFNGHTHTCYIYQKMETGLENFILNPTIQKIHFIPLNAFSKAYRPPPNFISGKLNCISMKQLMI